MTTAISIGYILMVTGGLGGILSLVLLAYSYRTKKESWRMTAHDTGMRAFLLLVIGFLILVFATI